MIPKAFLLTLGQIGDARFLRVLLTGIALAIALLAGFGAVFVWLTGWLIGDGVSLPWLGEINWLDNAASWGAGLVLLVLSVFLMVPVAAAISSLFLDNVADAVEEKHYPHLPQSPRVPFGESVRDAIVFLGVIAGVNLLALVLYVLFAPFALFIFWAVNGFLLGREYFILAAARRIGMPAAKALRRKHFGTIWLAGVLMAIPLTVPLFNLVVPILGAASFTHLYHMVTRSRAGQTNVPHRPQ